MKFLKTIISIIYVTLLIVMGGATFVEISSGTDYVHQNFYGAPWFSWLWFSLVAFGLIYILMCIKGRKERRVPVILLHLSFVVILSGAMITHEGGRCGTIHLRLNEPQDIVDITQDGNHYRHRLNFKVELTDFQIIEDEEGKVKDYRSEFKIRKEERPVLGDTIAESLSVSMNNIAKYGSLRFYQMSYDYDGRGSTLMINRDPWGIPVTYCGYGLLFASFIWLVVRRNRQSRECRECRDYQDFRHYRQSRIIGATLLLTAAWCLWYFVLDGSWAEIPVLRSPLLVFHVVTIILAYALLLIQTGISTVNLFKDFKVSKDSKDLKAPNLPNLQILRLALCFLTIGIFLGAIWANISWGNYWSWDPKEVWALVTMMVYAVPLHRSSIPLMRNPKAFHLFMIFAFLVLLMTYFGVNYFLTGMHSYA